MWYGRVGKKARRVFLLVRADRARRAHVSSHSPLAKMSRLITRTELREKNRLPAVYGSPNIEVCASVTYRVKNRADE